MLVVVDLSAIAFVQTFLGTEVPDCVLHELWKSAGIFGAKLAGIDFHGQLIDDVSTTARLIARWSIGVGFAKPAENAGADQEIVDQPVDSDQVRSRTNLIISRQPSPMFSFSTAFD